VADYIGNLRTIYLHVEAGIRGGIPVHAAGVNTCSTSADTSNGPVTLRVELRMDLRPTSAPASPSSTRRLRMYRPTSGDRGVDRQQFPVPRHLPARDDAVRRTGWYLGTGTGNASCYPSETSYNAKTLTSGAELAAGSGASTCRPTTSRSCDLLPLIAQPAQFLLSYAQGRRRRQAAHLPVQRHETQWTSTDPITDIVR